MTLQDAKTLSRTGQFLVVETRAGYDSPPVFDSNWQPLWSAKIDRIEIKRGNKPSVATIWFPQLRWEESAGLLRGDMLRIRTDEPASADRTIVFVGFVTGKLSDFSGGTEQQHTAFERNAVVCQDHRWLLASTSPILGQYARGPDDYNDYGTMDQEAKEDSCCPLNGRRTIFNAGGRPNCDPNLYTVKDSAGTEYCKTPIFADPSAGIYWTARDMVRYVLNPLYNRAYRYLPIKDPNELAGLNNADWDTVLSHVVVDGLNVLDAIELICNRIGWSFCEDYFNDDTVTFTFYEIAAASGYTRSYENPTILHRLHAPAAGESVDSAIADGKKLLWSMSLAEDITSVVNNPVGLGSPHRFEFTAELVPAWLDNDLEPDTSEDNANLFFTESDLQEMTEPDTKSFYKHYHPRGSEFRRDVARRWALNESGKYSVAPAWVKDNYYNKGKLVNNDANTYKAKIGHLATVMNQPPRISHWEQIDGYARGMPFDFSSVIDAQYIRDENNKRIFGPFNRRLLPCLTVDKDTLNSVGIKVEFSFDAGSTWLVIPAAISSLEDECSIYIDEANLAELVGQSQSTISDGVLDGVELNYWTSLCDDKLNERSFKEKKWNTRIRITASVQMDIRAGSTAVPKPSSGSPFHHSQIYDFSAKFGLTKRTSSSSFADSDLPAYEVDASDWFDTQLDSIRRTNEDASISGQFTLERLWLGDGAGRADFAIGDCIERITGREYDLSASLGGGSVYPEIIQIIYLPDKQKMKLITRDLRFAEVTL